MPIIDAQVHAYERDHPGRPWAAKLHGEAEVTGDEMIKAMDAVGVDAAVLVSPFTMYRYDASYALQVHAAHPGRFALVKPVDPTDPAVADTIADWAKVDGAVAVRIMMTRGVSEDAADPGLARVLAAAARSGLPVNLLCWGRLEQVAQMAARHPQTTLVIDHLGLQQPFEPPPPAQPFAELRRFWHWPRTPTLRSRSAAPAPCRTSPSLTQTSGTRSGAYSTPFASVAACGAPTGPAQSGC